MDWNGIEQNTFFSTQSGLALCMTGSVEITRPVRVAEDSDIVVIQHLDSEDYIAGYEFLLKGKDYKLLKVDLLVYIFFRQPSIKDNFIKIYSDSIVSVAATVDKPHNYIIGSIRGE